MRAPRQADIQPVLRGLTAGLPARLGRSGTGALQGLNRLGPLEQSLKRDPPRYRKRPPRRDGLSLLLALLAGALFALLRVAGEGAAIGLVLLACLISSALLAYRLRGRRAVRVATLRKLRSLPPAAFEEAIADLLRNMGYRNVRIVGGAGDLAVDVLCEDGRGRRVAVQCKRYREDHPVTSEELQRFIGMLVVEHGADRGIYVTTSRFTKPALEIARRHRVEAWDGRKLADFLSGSKRGKASAS